MPKQNLESTIIASLSACQKKSHLGDMRFIRLMEFLESKKGNSDKNQYDRYCFALAMRYCEELIRIFYYDVETQFFGIEMPEKTEKQIDGKGEWLDCILAIWGLSDGYQDKGLGLV